MKKLILFFSLLTTGAISAPVDVGAYLLSLKAQADQSTTHLSDTVSHIIASERTQWNNTSANAVTNNQSVVTFGKVSFANGSITNRDDGLSITTNLTVYGLSRIILPTSTNGLSSGMLWNNIGVVSIMP